MQSRQQRRHDARQQAKRDSTAIFETPLKTAIKWAFSPNPWRAAPAAKTPDPAPAIAIECNQQTSLTIAPLRDAGGDAGAEKTKRCPDCNQTKALSEFPKASKRGWSKRCRPCSNARQLAYTWRTEPDETDAVRGPKIRTPEKICEGCRKAYEYQHFKKDPDGLFGVSDFCVLCATILSLIKGELTLEPYPQMRGAGVIENYSQDEEQDEEL